MSDTRSEAPAASEAAAVDIAASEAAAIVVGGGPAGLFLAARLSALRASEGRGVLVLEKKAKPGRKLLASGAGQCNISHSGEMDGFLERYGGAGRFLKKALFGFTNEDLSAWLGERGMALEAEEGGKLFPASRRAADVLDLLLGECRRLGAELRADSRVLSAKRGGDGCFLVETESQSGLRGIYRAPLLAIATGGLSYPGTGSSGDGYSLARSLGHTIVPPRPALAPVILADTALCALAGLSFEGLSFTLRRGGKKVRSLSGDILITHEGLSGPGILDSSRLIEPGDLLELDFSGKGLEAFRSELATRCSASPRALARTVLAEAGLPRRLAELLCSMAAVGPEDRCSSLKREARLELARLAAAFPAEVAALGGFEKAMATAGGVSLDEVDSATMGSRLAGGLYFAGEVLDYDGDTGGFNLQAAFSTADAAARAMAARESA